MKDVPDLVGREKELARLGQAMDNALGGRGETFLISGEAGIGKTRLTNEILKSAASHGAAILTGWCLADSLEPLMPMRSAFRESGLDHLFTGEKPPNLLGLFLMTKAGMLISKSEREESDMDPDIFAGMLTAVSNFVKDSLAGMKGAGKGDGLNIMGYEEYRIIIEHGPNCSLAAVISGKENEMFLDDLKQVVANVESGYSSVIPNWSGNMREVAGAGVLLNSFMGLGKYTGRFIEDDPRILQENLFDNVLRGIQRLSGERPLVLFLDDLQWSDSASLGMLHYISRNIRSNRVLVLGTYRPEDIIDTAEGKAHQLERTMQNMSREGLFSLIELSRLDCDNTGLLISDLLSPNSLEPGFFERVHRETGGTPFFIVEVIKLLVSEGSLAPDKDGAWRLTAELEGLAVPSKVFDVVNRRLDRLEKSQKEILEAASVIGDEFDSGTVSHIVGMGRLPLLKALSEIEKTHRLIHSSQNRYVFDHAKMREVLYNGIMEELRQEYHRMVGEFIIGRDPTVPDQALGELAYHLYKARDKRAGKLLSRAGDIAKAAYSNQEAVRSYLRALEFLTETEERVSVCQNLGNIFDLLGDYARSLEYFTIALELEPSPGKKADMHFRMSHVHDQLGNYEKCLEHCREGLRLVADRDEVKKAKLLNIMSWTYLKSGDNANADKYLAEGLPLTERAWRGAAQSDPALRPQDVLDLATTMNNIGLIFQYKGELGRALECFTTGLEMYNRIERKSHMAIAQTNIANTFIDLGELDKALDQHEAALAINKSVGSKSSIAHSLTCIGYTYFEMGQYARVLECQEQSLKICSEIGYRTLEVYNHYSMAEALACLGDWRAALGSAESTMALSSEISFPLGTTMGLRALGMAHMGAGEPDKAEHEFRKSLETLEKIGEKREIARTKYEFGLLCLAQDRAQEAAELLGEALGEFETMGMKLWVERTLTASKSLPAPGAP